MKKLFTLMAFSLLMSLNVDAQFRKTWDFSKGYSAETKANLNADPNWVSNRTDANTGETTGWKDNAKMSGELMANGMVIEELRGINFSTSGLQNNGNYLLDPTTIRVARKKMAFSLPKLAAGQKVTIVAKSANGTATDRGFKGNDNMEYIDGPANGICPGPDGLCTLVWQVKADVVDSVDITISTDMGGLDIQSIVIDDGDAPDVEKAKKVAYIADAATIDADMAYIFLSATDGVELTQVDPVADITLDSLQYYDAIVVAPSVAANAGIVPTLKSAIAYEPVLNMNAALYEAWGYGKPVATSEMSVTVPTEMADNALFADLDITSGLELLTDGGITGVSLGEYFANDAVLATAGEAVAIHQHNAARNTYLFLPYTEEGLAAANQDILPVILGNAVKMVAKTKKAIVATGAPVITKENKDGETTVTISTTNTDASIYYTTDSSEPTTASTLYTEPFTLTEACTVKAIATLDGYLQSNTTSLDIDIMSQAATPAISIEKNADNSVVTLTCATEGAEIYYSYGVVTDKAKAQKYVEPITLKAEPTEIYAFAVAEGYVQSGLASDYVAINSLNAQTIRIDTLTHFDANSADWFVDNSENGGTGKESAYYYWGKNAWKYYSDEVDHTETVKDSQGNDSIVYYYKPDPAAVRVINPNTPNGWILKSAGQVLTGELTLTAEAAVGNGATGRFAETAEDMIGGTPTTGCITFGGKTSGEPYTASIETTEKYAAPFDVVTYVGNGNNGNPGNLEIQVSADGEAWDSIGTVSMASTQRYYKKTRVSCDKTGEYFVRVWQKSGSTKAQLYDIYVLNNGENSKKYDASTVGIDNVGGSDELVRDEIFSVNGVRLNTLGKGINIIRKHYADGTVKTVKVMVK